MEFTLKKSKRSELFRIIFRTVEIQRALMGDDRRFWSANEPLSNISIY
jgi:hypothetical protein